MNMAIAFFVGCITFVLMMIIKIPVKKITAILAENRAENPQHEYILYKRYNIVIMLLTMIMAMLCYYWVLQVLEIEHIKWCCSLKAGAIAMAIYTVFEQFVGDGQDRGNER